MVSLVHAQKRRPQRENQAESFDERQIAEDHEEDAVGNGHLQLDFVAGQAAGPPRGRRRTDRYPAAWRIRGVRDDRATTRKTMLIRSLHGCLGGFLDSALISTIALTKAKGQAPARKESIQPHAGGSTIW